MKALAVIPSRYHSTRFDGKALAMILDKPMVVCVYEAVKNSGLFDKVVVATDDRRIYERVRRHKGEAMLTNPNCANGTERCNEVVNILENEGERFDIMVNVQGDEPLIKKAMMQSVINGFKNTDAQIVTLRKCIDDIKDLKSPDVVKVVCVEQKALYFSRSAIPFSRDGREEDLIKEGMYYKHIGIYGYRIEVLKEIVGLKESSLESIEKLEQLRWLENGFNIYAIETKYDSVGVDTKQDLDRVIKIISNNEDIIGA